MPLALRKINVFPAEKPGINGPSARSDHGQCGAKGRKEYWNPRITGAREKYPGFDNGYHRSRHRGPKTDEEKQPRASRNDLRGDRCRLIGVTKGGYSAMN
jgi:hypothetical protein